LGVRIRNQYETQSRKRRTEEVEYSEGAGERAERGPVMEIVQIFMVNCWVVLLLDFWNLGVDEKREVRRGEVEGIEVKG